jgi:photosystem II stability/assembly factor-like uncharacterized protein
MPRPNVRSSIAAALLCVATIARAAEVRDSLYGVRALGPTEAFAVGTFGAIVHTADGGRTWTTQDSGTRVPLFSVDFADAQHGWAVGKSGLVLGTADGGKTWTPQPTPVGTGKHFFKVKAVDPQTAWVVGDWGAMTSTADGGRTWTDRSLGKISIIADETGGRRSSVVTDDVILYDVSFPDARHGYVCGEFGSVIATDDGGQTWRLRRTPTEKTLFGIHFTTPDEGWAVGIDGLLIHTQDGGRTWTVQHGRPETAAVDEISFVEQMQNPGMYAVRVAGKHGVVVGDVGMLLVSDDGGRSWRRLLLPEAQRLVWMRDVSLVPDAGGFLVGANGFRAVVDANGVAVAGSGERATAVP